MTEQNTVTAQDMATVHNTATAQNTATEQNTATAFGTKQGQNMANDRKTALALGATGGFGGEMARASLGRGWRVRAISSAPRPDRQADRGYRMDARRRHEPGGHCCGGRGHRPDRAWRQPAGLPELARPGIADAREHRGELRRASGARIFVPGTVYNFGPDVFPLVAEDAPQHPRTRKGAIRVEMEACLRAASDHGVRTLILRGGDWFGPNASGNSWFGAALVKPGRRVCGRWSIPDGARSRPRLGLPARLRGDRPAIDRTRCGASGLRRVPFRRPLVRAWRRNRGSRADSGWGQAFADPEVPVVAGRPGLAVRGDVPRDARDDLSLAAAAPPRSTAASWPSLVRGPHADGGRGAGQPGRVGLPRQMVVGLKAVQALDSIHSAHCINYLKLSGLRLCARLKSDKVRLEMHRAVNGI